MDSKVAAVLQGFVALTPAQRDAFVALANEYINGTEFTRDRIVRESNRTWGITKVDLGPTSQTCPCCGR